MVDRGPVKEASVEMVLLDALDKKEPILRTLAGKSRGRGSSGLRKSPAMVSSYALGNGFS